MITPLVEEKYWTTFLGGLPAFEPSAAPMVVVSPHPDDETLGCGGLIAHQRSQGISVTVIAVTDGDNAYTDWPGLGEVRRREQENALLHLGVDHHEIYRLRLIDSDVAASESQLSELLASFLPPGATIVAPWESDFHPDHEACGRAAKKAANTADAVLVSYLFWTWHRGDPGCLAGLPLYSFNLDEELMQKKTAALRCHQSQLFHDSGQPILPDYLLEPARRPYEVFIRPCN